jgi:hypothetical protein
MARKGIRLEHYEGMAGIATWICWRVVIVTWNGRPALPPLTPQQDRMERSAIDMKWASRNIRMCFS